MYNRVIACPVHGVVREVFKPKKIENRLHGRHKKLLKDHMGREGQRAHFGVVIRYQGARNSPR